MDGSIADSTPDSRAPVKRSSNGGQLSRIAELLGCPVESFYETDAAGDATAQASELLRLWTEIRDPTARKQVLDLARALARS